MITVGREMKCESESASESVGVHFTTLRQVHVRQTTDRVCLSSYCLSVSLDDNSTHKTPSTCVSYRDRSASGDE